MTDALKDEFPDPETELAFLDFLATEWPNWRHHVGSDYWHIRRRSFLAGRPAPQALAATPAVGWTPDPKAPWRCLICGSERSACTCLPRERATPAVGGEPVAWLYEMAFAIKPSADPAFTKWKQVVTLDPPPTIPKDGVRNVSPLFAAQPASPLRGRDLLPGEAEADAWIASLPSASPPEQPAALPLAVRLRDEAGPPLPQMVAQRRAQLSQEQPAQPQSLAGCLHPGTEPKSCQYEGRCLSTACNHNGKTWYGPRMTLEAQVDGILYPKVET